jgi:hypothetical protein
LGVENTEELSTIEKLATTEDTENAEEYFQKRW